MPETKPASKDHEIYIFDGPELLQELKKVGGEAGHDAKRGVSTVLGWNEDLKDTVLADAVAIGQLLQNSAKVVQQIRLLGVFGHAYMKEVGKKKYIIFKGRAGLRPNLKGTRYLAENPKVRCFVVGSKDIWKDAAEGTKIAVVAMVAIDITQEVLSDHPSLVGLGVQITSDVAQAAASAIIGAGAGVFLLALVPTAPVAIVFVTVVGMGFLAGMGLTALDNHFGLTKTCRRVIITWEKRLEREIAADYRTTVAAASHAYTASRVYLQQEAVKVRRLYSDGAAMISGEMSYDSFLFMP
jgi:hypothetical protein